MSNSDEANAPFKPDVPLRISKNPPKPQAGYGLVFTEQFTQEIAEFVSSPLFKKLKKYYGPQAKDRAARLCLNSAQNTEWLMYYKGIAASAGLFFQDLEAARDEWRKQHTEADPKDNKFKK